MVSIFILVRDVRRENHLAVVIMLGNRKLEAIKKLIIIVIYTLNHSLTTKGDGSAKFGMLLYYLKLRFFLNRSIIFVYEYLCHSVYTGRV